MTEPNLSYKSPFRPVSARLTALSVKALEQYPIRVQQPSNSSQPSTPNASRGGSARPRSAAMSSSSALVMAGTGSELGMASPDGLVSSTALNAPSPRNAMILHKTKGAAGGLTTLRRIPRPATVGADEQQTREALISQSALKPVARPASAGLQQLLQQLQRQQLGLVAPTSTSPQPTFRAVEGRLHPGSPTAHSHDVDVSQRNSPIRFRGPAPLKPLLVTLDEDTLAWTAENSPHRTAAIKRSAKGGLSEAASTILSVALGVLMDTYRGALDTVYARTYREVFEALWLQQRLAELSAAESRRGQAQRRATGDQPTAPSQQRPSLVGATGGAGAVLALGPASVKNAASPIDRVQAILYPTPELTSERLTVALTDVELARQVEQIMAFLNGGGGTSLPGLTSAQPTAAAYPNYFSNLYTPSASNPPSSTVTSVPTRIGNIDTNTVLSLLSRIQSNALVEGSPSADGAYPIKGVPRGTAFAEFVVAVLAKQLEEVKSARAALRASVASRVADQEAMLDTPISPEKGLTELPRIELVAQVQERPLDLERDALASTMVAAPSLHLEPSPFNSKKLLEHSTKASTFTTLASDGTPLKPYSSPTYPSLGVLDIADRSRRASTMGPLLMAAASSGVFHPPSGQHHSPLDNSNNDLLLGTPPALGATMASSLFQLKQKQHQSNTADAQLLVELPPNAVPPLSQDPLSVLIRTFEASKAAHEWRAVRTAYLQGCVAVSAGGEAHPNTSEDAKTIHAVRKGSGGDQAGRLNIAPTTGVRRKSTAPQPPRKARKTAVIIARTPGPSSLSAHTTDSNTQKGPSIPARSLFTILPDAYIPPSEVIWKREEEQLRAQQQKRRMTVGRAPQPTAVTNRAAGSPTGLEASNLTLLVGSMSNTVGGLSKSDRKREGLTPGLADVLAVPDGEDDELSTFFSADVAAKLAAKQKGAPKKSPSSALDGHIIPNEKDLPETSQVDLPTHASPPTPTTFSSVRDVLLAMQQTKKDIDSKTHTTYPTILRHTAVMEYGNRRQKALLMKELYGYVPTERDLRVAGAATASSPNSSISSTGALGRPADKNTESIEDSQGTVLSQQPSSAALDHILVTGHRTSFEAFDETLVIPPLPPPKTFASSGTQTTLDEELALYKQHRLFNTVQRDIAMRKMLRAIEIGISNMVAFWGQLEVDVSCPRCLETAGDVPYPKTLPKSAAEQRRLAERIATAEAEMKIIAPCGISVCATCVDAEDDFPKKEDLMDEVDDYTSNVDFAATLLSMVASGSVSDFGMKASSPTGSRFIERLPEAHKKRKKSIADPFANVESDETLLDEQSRIRKQAALGLPADVADLKNRMGLAIDHFSNIDNRKKFIALGPRSSCLCTEHDGTYPSHTMSAIRKLYTRHHRQDAPSTNAPSATGNRESIKGGRPMMSSRREVKEKERLLTEWAAVVDGLRNVEEDTNPQSDGEPSIDFVSPLANPYAKYVSPPPTNPVLRDILRIALKSHSAALGHPPGSSSDEDEPSSRRPEGQQLTRTRSSISTFLKRGDGDADTNAQKGSAGTTTLGNNANSHLLFPKLDVDGSPHVPTAGDLVTLRFALRTIEVVLGLEASALPVVAGVAASNPRPAPKEIIGVGDVDAHKSMRNRRIQNVNQAPTTTFLKEGADHTATPLMPFPPTTLQGTGHHHRLHNDSHEVSQSAKSAAPPDPNLESTMSPNSHAHHRPPHIVPTAPSSQHQSAPISSSLYPKYKDKKHRHVRHRRQVPDKEAAAFGQRAESEASETNSTEVSKDGRQSPSVATAFITSKGAVHTFQLQQGNTSDVYVTRQLLRDITCRQVAKEVLESLIAIAMAPSEASDTANGPPAPTSAQAPISLKQSILPAHGAYRRGSRTLPTQVADPRLMGRLPPVAAADLPLFARAAFSAERDVVMANNVIASATLVARGIPFTTALVGEERRRAAAAKQHEMYVKLQEEAATSSITGGTGGSATQV